MRSPLLGVKAGTRTSFRAWMICARSVVPVHVNQKSHPRLTREGVVLRNSRLLAFEAEDGGAQVGRRNDELHVLLLSREVSGM
jgi:hypothetical protein